MDPRRIARASFPVLAVLSTAAVPARALGDRPGGARAAAVERVRHDASSDGALHVRGSRYKARFDAAGATYVPALGPKAPRSFPATFRLAEVRLDGEAVAFDAAAAPARAGEAVVYERGSLVERYEIRLDSIEQVLVLESLPRGGELVVRYAVESELAARDAGDAIELSGPHGSVRYGKAIVLDARGARAPAPTALVGGGIEIRVPAAFLATAAFPVTIDPVVTTFAVDTTTPDDFLPDVAYDATTGRTIFVYEETYSATDHDVYQRTFDAGGGLVAEGYVDISGDDWRRPRVANNGSADQFLVVAEVGAVGARSIGARTIAAASGAMGSPTIVAPAYTHYERRHPDVGGDPAPTGTTNYLVVYEEHDNASGHTWIVKCLVDQNGQSSSGTICLQCVDGEQNVNPAVSNSAGEHPSQPHRWTVVWEHVYGPGDHDVWGAQLFNALTVVAPFPIDTSIVDDRRPTVSSFAESGAAPGNYLVAFERPDGADADIKAHVLNGSTILATANLSELEGPAFAGQSQVAASADTDGLAFVVAYSELFSTSSVDWDVYVSTFALSNGSIVPVETHQNLAYTSDPDLDPRIASWRGSPARRFATAWTQVAGGVGDIHAGFYDRPAAAAYCHPGENGVAACPCGNPGWNGGGCDNSSATGGAVLAASGNASLAADTLAFTQSFERPTAFSIFLQGNADVPAGAVFGEGIRCAGGTLKRLYQRNAVGGVVSAPIGADPRVAARSAALGDPIAAGATRFYQVYYRDPNLPACAATFNAGNGMRVLWGP